MAAVAALALKSAWPIKANGAGGGGPSADAHMGGGGAVAVDRIPGAHVTNTHLTE